VADQERTEAQIIEEISTFIAELLAVRCTPITPFVSGWALSVHADSVEWDRDDHSRSEYFWPTGQTYPTTTGLFALALQAQVGDA